MMDEAAAAVVDRQVAAFNAGDAAAFNAGDAAAFAATYAEDAEVAWPLGGPPPLLGRPAIEAHYAALFAAHPTLRATVEGRVAAGPLVSDRERVEPFGVLALATYEVAGGLIRRAWLFGPVPA